LGVSNWLRWLEAEIHPEVMTMNLHRHVFRELGAIVERNGTPPSYSFELSSLTYATSSRGPRRDGEEVVPARGRPRLVGRSAVSSRCWP
jgi:hypothetical protein